MAISIAIRKTDTHTHRNTTSRVEVAARKAEIAPSVDRSCAHVAVPCTRMQLHRSSQEDRRTCIVLSFLAQRLVRRIGQELRGKIAPVIDSDSRQLNKLRLGNGLSEGAGSGLGLDQAN